MPSAPTVEPGPPPAVRLGAWVFDPVSGELASGADVRTLEPKAAALLALLVERAGDVVGRDEVVARLWPGVIVGDDSLPRLVSKLRQALGDDARSPQYVQTLPKRGLRLRVEPRPLDAASAPPPVPRRSGRYAAAAALAVAMLVAALALPWRPPQPDPADPRTAALARADDHYFQFSRTDNEAAAVLYERVLAMDPDDASAQAGLANVLVQRAVRWSADREFRTLGAALRSGHLGADPAARQIERALRLAGDAVARDPDNAAAHKALGFATAAAGRIDEARGHYERAIALDPDAWGAMINLAEAHTLSGDDAASLDWLVRAYDAMERQYRRDAAKVRPWHGRLGVMIAGRRLETGDAADAEAWYRRVLARDPLSRPATAGLARLLRGAGDASAAQRLCDELAARTRIAEPCKDA